MRQVAFTKCNALKFHPSQFLLLLSGVPLYGVSIHTLTSGSFPLSDNYE